jgi:hypothetical protein
MYNRRILIIHLTHAWMTIGRVNPKEGTFPQKIKHFGFNKLLNANTRNS